MQFIILPMAIRVFSVVLSALEAKAALIPSLFHILIMDTEKASVDFL